MDFVDLNGQIPGFVRDWFDMDEETVDELMDRAKELTVRGIDSVAERVEPWFPVVNNVWQDIKAYDKSNISEEIVFNANYFSYYRGQRVIRQSLSRRSGSFGPFIFLSTSVTDNVDGVNTVMHESGHNHQYSELGLQRFTAGIAPPSILSWKASNYSAQPWEIHAEIYGGVNHTYTLDEIERGVRFMHHLNSLSISDLPRYLLRYGWRTYNHKTPAIDYLYNK